MGLGGKTKAIRLPAHDVERQVTLRLQSFLQSNHRVMSELSLPSDSPALTRGMIAAANTADPSAAGKDFLNRVVRRVVVHSDRLEVEIGKKELRATLTQQGPGPAHLRDETELASGDSIRLEVRTQLSRHGGETCLVVPPDSVGYVPPTPISSLVKAIARGRQWHSWIVSGEAPSQRAIAKKLGLNERYVGRVLECAFLAPDR